MSVRARRTAIAAAVIAALAVLAWQWPRIVAFGNADLAAIEWRPDRDAGVTLRLQIDGWDLEVGHGTGVVQAIAASTDSDRCERIGLLQYRESDGVPGSAHDGIGHNSKRTTSGVRPIEVTRETGHGCEHGDHFEATFGLRGAGEQMLTVAPPPLLTRSATGARHELALLPRQGLALHWRQDAGELTIEVEPLGDEPVAPIDVGQLMLAGQPIDFAVDGGGRWHASLPLAQIPTNWFDRPLNAVVELDRAGKDALTVTLRRP